MHFSFSFAPAWWAYPGSYGAQMYFSLLSCAILHQTPNLLPSPNPRAYDRVIQSKTEKLSPSYHHYFVTIRIVVGAQLCTPVLSFDQMLLLYRGGLDSNMKQNKINDSSISWLLFARLIRHTTRITINIPEKYAVCTEHCGQQSNYSPLFRVVTRFGWMYLLVRIMFSFSCTSTLWVRQIVARTKICCCRINSISHWSMTIKRREIFI